jgi:hypothetical protein
MKILCKIRIKNEISCDSRFYSMPAHCEEDSFRPANLSVAANLLYFSLRVSVRVDDAAEADGPSAIAARRHE